MSRGLGAMATIFVVVLAVIIGLRMSSETMAVVAGVICGAAAGIPMSLLILAVNGRREHRAAQPDDSGSMLGRYRPYPPVVVIQGGMPAGGAFMPPYDGASPVLMQAAPRRFRIVGESEEP